MRSNSIKTIVLSFICSILIIFAIVAVHTNAVNVSTYNPGSGVSVAYASECEKSVREREDLKKPVKPRIPEMPIPKIRTFNRHF